MFLVSGLTACPSSVGPIPIGCEFDPPEVFTSHPGIVRAGVPARLRVQPAVHIDCDAATPSWPTSATVEIEGPGGEPLASKIDLGTPDTLSVIEFTPERPGPHHVVVAFQQVGGLQQFDLHAAMDRSAEAPSQSLPLPCPTLERTAQGLWVCGSAILRGDQVLGEFSAAKLAVAGDVLWAVDGSSIRRFVDTGTQLLLTGSVPPQHSGTEFLLATPNELIVLHAYSMTYYTFNGSSLTATHSLPWPRASDPVKPNGPQGVLVREGDRMALATRFKSGDISMAQVCSYALSSGRFEPLPGKCAEIPGEVSGFEPGTLWMKDQPAGLKQGLLRRWRLTGDQLVEQGSLFLGTLTSVSEWPMLGWASVPVLRNTFPTESAFPTFAVPTWSPQKQMLLLDHLDGEVTDASATATFFLGRTASVTHPTRVRIRPPPP